MNMDYGLFQQQTMKLTMTNELRQAITILHYSALDLNEYLLEQQLENPLIELKEPTVAEETAIQKMNDTPIYDVKTKYQGEEDYSPIDHIREHEEGLQDYLLNQIRLLNIEKKVRSIVTYLALSLDQNGYLQQSVSELMEELSVTEETLERGMETLYSLEPYGVGARTLRECLLIQLKHMGMEDSLMERVVSKHLELLAKNQFKKIAKEEQVTVEDIQSVADHIKTLNPKPGAEFNRETPKYVVPDATVMKIDEDYVVRLNEEHMPKMFMNQDYKQMVKNKHANVEGYMKQKYDQFHWIRRSIEQRQQTILKVTESIVSHQSEFFTYGASHLKPLTLKTIAEEVGVHESTVSRATTNKYVQTPRGLYELRFFFVSTVGRDSNESSSSEKVKTLMKRLVNEEKKQKPLSDQKLSDLLNKEFQINVSRRTVAKYREEMQIASSSQRKRYS